MYYGYMKRGTSLLVYFCLFIMLGAIISPLVVGVAVVYMFSFFDTYDLIRYLVAGDPKPDGSCSRRTGRISSAVPKPK